jgi:uncharacterized protein (TIGR00369 family)
LRIVALRAVWEGVTSERRLRPAGSEIRAYGQIGMAEDTRSTAHSGVVTPELLASMSGLEYLQKMQRGDVPGMPIAETLDFNLTDVEEGRAVFASTPRIAHYNAIGTVHAGYTATLLDSCMACAVLSALPKGTGFTTMEFKVSLLRPVTKNTGLIRAEGTLMSRGRRGATAEGRLTDTKGKLLAHATTTCLIFEF